VEGPSIAKTVEGPSIAKTVEVENPATRLALRVNELVRQR